MRKLMRNAGPAAFGLAVLGSILLGGAARAETAAHKLLLSGYADGPQGEALLAGRYDLVIVRLAAHGAPFDADEVSASTNLCVAYIMSRHWNSAETVCDEALRDAKLDAPEPTMFSRLARNEEVAIAYSNRAVLKLIEGRAQSAADDLAKARTLSHADFISRNESAASALTTTVAAARE
ncbi:MAG TPA: hypothetical protein VMD49_11035 [Steroidobacteraceae bacterium]|nr:hypothetical protein [Steroidobacteraceae bacterium]